MMRRSRWRFVPVALLGIVDAWVVVAATVSLGAAGEERWASAARWAAATAIPAAFALLAVVVRWSNRPGAEAAIAAIATGGAGALVALVALLFGMGNTVIGDFTVAAACLVGVLGGALVALVAALAWQRSRVRVLPPFRPLTPDTFKDDIDPPAYPRPPGR